MREGDGCWRGQTEQNIDVGTGEATWKPEGCSTAGREGRCQRRAQVSGMVQKRGRSWENSLLPKSKNTQSRSMKKMVKRKGRRTAQHPLVAPLLRRVSPGKEEPHWPPTMIALQHWLLNLLNLPEIAKPKGMARAPAEIITVCWAGSTQMKKNVTWTSLFSGNCCMGLTEKQQPDRRGLQQ